MTGLPVIEMDLTATYNSTVKAGAASQRISDVSDPFKKFASSKIGSGCLYFSLLIICLQI